MDGASLPAMLAGCVYASPMPLSVSVLCSERRRPGPRLISKTNHPEPAFPPVRAVLRAGAILAVLAAAVAPPTLHTATPAANNASSDAPARRWLTARRGRACRGHVGKAPLDFEIRGDRMSPSRPYAAALIASNDGAAYRRTRRNGRSATEGGDERADTKSALSVRAPPSRTGSPGGNLDALAASRPIEARTRRPITQAPRRSPPFHTETPAANDATRDAHARRPPRRAAYRRTRRNAWAQRNGRCRWARLPSIPHPMSNLLASEHPDLIDISTPFDVA
jgi:hypothetical protein